MLNNLVFGTSHSQRINCNYDFEASMKNNLIVSKFRNNLERSLIYAYKQGIRYFDTAIWYGTQSILNRLKFPDSKISTKLLIEPPQNIYQLLHL